MHLSWQPSIHGDIKTGSAFEKGNGSVKLPFWIHSPQLLHRPHYPLPHRVAAQVALFEHGIRPHGGMDRRVIAVLFHEDVGAGPCVVASLPTAMRIKLSDTHRVGAG